MSSINLLVIGFGISDKQSFDRANKYVDGAIMGTAFVKTIGNKEDYLSHIPEFISKIKGV